MSAESREKKLRPPTMGLAVVADLWLWGALLLFAPTYLDITSGWRYVFYALGFISLIFSFAGAAIELGKLWQTEGLSYWGVSLVFLIPAIALYFAVERQFIDGLLGIIAKIAAFILVAVGGPMFFHGIPYFFWKRENTEKTESELEIAQRERSKSQAARTNFEIIANIAIALLALATAIVTLVEKVIP